MHRPSLALPLASLLACACGDSGRAEGDSATATATATATVTVTAGASSSSGDSDSATTTPTTTGESATSAGSSTDPLPGTSTGPALPGTSTGPDATTTGLPDTTTGLPDTTTGPDTGRPMCDDFLEARIRDFKSSHPDFEKFGGDLKGIVKVDLGPDKKPVYAAAGATAVTSGPENFAQWYNDTANINIPEPTQLQLTEVMPGLYQYKNNTFFPVDGKGWGNEGNDHNFHFTTEIHTTFEYNGGEVFTFTGDDDVWVFINNKLAIDLGGVHGEQSESIDLDMQSAALAITKGNSYAMDIFHAERHTTQSNFRIDTTIACFIPQ
ncbi:MAG: fibro-slime domain-containing protein [Myxococcales bacterium]|nr:fibro-slime domain-containing protein [Myxococcales bacterium]